MLINIISAKNLFTAPPLVHLNYFRMINMTLILEHSNNYVKSILILNLLY